MNRREFLSGAAVAPAALLPPGANADEGLPSDAGAALAQFRKSIPSNFDQDYVEHVLIPFFLTSVFKGSRLCFP